MPDSENRALVAIVCAALDTLGQRVGEQSMRGLVFQVALGELMTRYPDDTASVQKLREILNV